MGRLFKILLLLGILAPLRVSIAWTQVQLPSELSEKAQLSLITVYPGDEIYSTFGHSTFRFLDPGAYDMVFNFGTFDYDDPMFVPKFTYGRLDYKLSVTSMRALLQSARQQNRTVVEQVLNFSPESVATLYARLAENYLPENRYYRYDFLYENCATVLLDLLQNNAYDTIRLDSTSTSTESFRQLLQPYINGLPLYDLGISIVLGSTVDRAATFEERSFLPIELMRAVGAASVRSNSDSTGADFPLVASVDTLFSTGDNATTPERDLRLLWILAGLGALWILGSRRARNRQLSTKTRRFIGDRILFGIIGTGGLIIAFVWFISEHSVGAGNWNLLWALPTHLIMAFFWRRTGAAVWRPYWLFTGTLVVLVIVLQPFISQSLHPALFPVLLIVLWRCSILIGAPPEAIR